MVFFFFFQHTQHEREQSRQAIVKVPPCCSLLKPASLGAGGEPWLPTAARWLCWCRARGAPRLILTSPLGSYCPFLSISSSLTNSTACFLYLHMWHIWSKACLRFVVVVVLSPPLSIRARSYFLLSFPLPWQLLAVWQKKARGEEKGLRALSWQMSSVIMPQRRNEAAGGLPSCREQRCQFPVLAAARAWHPYMASQNSSPWLPSVPFRAANRISTHRLVFLFSPPTVPMTSSLLHSAASRVTLLGFLAVVVVVFYFIFFKRGKKKRQMHTRHRAQCFRQCSVKTPKVQRAEADEARCAAFFFFLFLFHN